jgi:hypothetical protein
MKDWKAHRSLIETHLFCKDYFQIYAVLMAEYDFRILYDSTKSSHNNWRFEYHADTEDYLNFELLNNEISKKPKYKNPFSKTEVIMLEAVNLEKELFALRQKINKGGFCVEGLLPELFEFVGISTGVYYRPEGRFIDSNWVCKDTNKKEIKKLIFDSPDIQDSSFKANVKQLESIWNELMDEKISKLEKHSEQSESVENSNITEKLPAQKAGNKLETEKFSMDVVDKIVDEKKTESMKSSNKTDIIRAEKSDNKLEAKKFIMDVDKIEDEEKTESMNSSNKTDKIRVEKSDNKSKDINFYNELRVQNSEFDVNKNIVFLTKFDKVFLIDPNFSIGGLNINELLLLKPSVWLSGNVIYSFFEYLQTQEVQKKNNLQHNKFFPNDIPNQRGKGNRATDIDLFNIAEKVFRKKGNKETDIVKDILDYDNIFFPTFQPMRSHFVLIVVNRKKKTIQLYDSIQSSKPTNTDYMKFYEKMFNHFEVKAKLEPTDFQLLKPKTPQQNNCYDCGVFVCMFAYDFLVTGSININSTQKKICYFRLFIFFSIIYNYEKEFTEKYLEISNNMEGNKSNCKESVPLTTKAIDYLINDEYSIIASNNNINNNNINNNNRTKKSKSNVSFEDIDENNENNEFVVSLNNDILNNDNDVINKLQIDISQVLNFSLYPQQKENILLFGIQTFMKSKEVAKSIIGFGKDVLQTCTIKHISEVFSDEEVKRIGFLRHMEDIYRATVKESIILLENEFNSKYEDFNKENSSSDEESIDDANFEKNTLEDDDIPLLQDFEEKAKQQELKKLEKFKKRKKSKKQLLSKKLFRLFYHLFNGIYNIALKDENVSIQKCIDIMTFNSKVQYLRNDLVEFFNKSYSYIFSLPEEDLKVFLLMLVENKGEKSKFTKSIARMLNEVSKKSMNDMINAVHNIDLRSNNLLERKSYKSMDTSVSSTKKRKNVSTNFKINTNKRIAIQSGSDNNQIPITYTNINETLLINKIDNNNNKNFNEITDISNNNNINFDTNNNNEKLRIENSNQETINKNNEINQISNNNNINFNSNEKKEIEMSIENNNQDIINKNNEITDNNNNNNNINFNNNEKKNIEMSIENKTANSNKKKNEELSLEELFKDGFETHDDINSVFFSMRGKPLDRNVLFLVVDENTQLPKQIFLDIISKDCDLKEKIDLIKDLPIFLIVKEIPKNFYKSTTGDGLCSLRKVYQLENKTTKFSEKSYNYATRLRALDVDLSLKKSRQLFLDFVQNKIELLKRRSNEWNVVSSTKTIEKLTEIYRLINESPARHKDFGKIFLEREDLWLIQEEVLSIIENMDVTIYQNIYFITDVMSCYDNKISHVLNDTSVRSNWCFLSELLFDGKTKHFQRTGLTYNELKKSFLCTNNIVIEQNHYHTAGNFAEPKILDLDLMFMDILYKCLNSQTFLYTMDDILQYFKNNSDENEIDYESGIKDIKNRIYDFFGIETDFQNNETTKINNTEEISKLNTETAIQNTVTTNINNTEDISKLNTETATQNTETTNINNTEDIAKLKIQNTETKINSIEELTKLDTETSLKNTEKSIEDITAILNSESAENIDEKVKIDIDVNMLSDNVKNKEKFIEDFNKFIFEKNQFKKELDEMKRKEAMREKKARENFLKREAAEKKEKELMAAKILQLEEENRQLKEKYNVKSS